MSPPQASRRQAATLVAATAVVLAVAAVVLGFASRSLVADIAIASARKQTLQCEDTAATWEPQLWQTLQDRLEWGLDLTPEDAVKHDLLSQLHACHGTQVWTDDEQRQHYYKLVREHAEASLQLRPGHATTLTRQAVAILLSGGEQAQVNAAWAAALKQGPNVQTNHPALAYVVLSNWEGATPEMQQWVRGLLGDAETGEGRWVLDMAESMGVQDKLQ